MLKRPIKLGDLLQKNINKAGVAKEVQAAMVCDNYLSALRETDIKPEALDKSKAIYYRNRILTVAVLGASWAQELQMRQHLIIKGINKKMGKGLVERIIFHVA